MGRFQGMADADKLNDLQILNRALFFENRGVWTYGVAANKLSATDVGRAVLELGAQNRADHEKHQGLLISAITDLGGTPVAPVDNYDLSSFIRRGQGDVDNDIHIAMLALAVEVGAAVGYIADTTQLKSPELIELEAGIASVEAIHVARIREAFNQLGVKMPIVPDPVMNRSSREAWVITLSAEKRAPVGMESSHP